MRLEIRHLELLLAVERAGSISGAARLLGTDQPHVTRQLRRIEEQLGHAVFERTGSGTRATTAGSDVLHRARAALRAFDAIDVPAEPDEPRNLHLLARWLDPTPIVALMKVQRPELTITTANAEPAAGRAELLAGTADMFLLVRIPHMRWPEPGPLVETEIVAEPTLVYMSVRHPLASRTEIELADLAEADWITGNTTETVRMLREECRLLGGFEPRLTYRSSENGVIRSLLEQGLAVVLGARSAPRTAGFVARPYRGATPAHWVLLHRPDTLVPRLVAGAAEAMRAHYAVAVARAEAGEGRVTDVG